MPSAPTRPCFVSGRLLRADDLELEQRYQLEGYRAADRTLHTWGIGEGLDPQASGPSRVTVSAGFALDSPGRQLVLADPAEIDLQSFATATAYLVLRYHEE